MHVSARRVCVTVRDARWDVGTSEQRGEGGGGGANRSLGRRARDMRDFGRRDGRCDGQCEGCEGGVSARRACALGRKPSALPTSSTTS
eukprot:3254975-Prymnesium_polylepis.1